jgi:YegS/Rv2252/BmrU family lipid kinase
MTDATSDPGELRLLVVSNADAGSNDEEAIATASRTWRDLGVDVEVVSTASAGELRDLVAGVDDRIVVAAGGDGSIHAVVQAVMDTERLDDLVLGLLPLGTGNDLARGLGIPRDPEPAARALVDGTAHSMDLMVDDDGTVAVNAVNLGVGAVASERAAGLKSALGPAAYPVGAVGAGVSEAGWRVTITVDDRVVVDDQSVLHVVVGNGPSIGGGTAAAPDARADDGVAEVVVSLATGGMARVGYATDFRRGTHTERDDVVVVQGRDVLIEGDSHAWNVDGELPPHRTRSHWVVRPGAWTLRHPGGTPDL